MYIECCSFSNSFGITSTKKCIFHIFSKKKFKNNYSSNTYNYDESNVLNNKKREFSNRFSRSKSWLLLIGSGYTLTGLMDNTKKMNTELKIGIGTLIFTYIIHKLWPKK